MLFLPLGIPISFDAFCSNDVVNHLTTIDQMSDHMHTMIPIQVLTEIDNSRNPMQLTRERLERAATENQFMNGKIQAIKVRTVYSQGCDHATFMSSLTANITMKP